MSVEELGSATGRYKRRHGPTLEQLNAIDRLVHGATDQETADAVGVHRVTVTRWRNYDVVFQAELNRRRREVWQVSTDKLRALLPCAVEALEVELLQGPARARTALEVVRMSGILDPGRERTPIDGSLVGPSDPTLIVDEIARARRPSPMRTFLEDEAVSEEERCAALAELETRLADDEEFDDAA